MNTDKTELIVFGNKYYTEKHFPNYIQAITDQMQRADYVRCLGAFIDISLTFKQHVNRNVKTAMYNCH